MIRLVSDNAEPVPAESDRPFAPRTATGTDTPEAPAGRGLMVFDFDDTLIEGDSLPRFVRRLVGSARFSVAFAGALASASAARLQGRDWKSALKAAFLRRALAGVALADAQALAEEMRGELNWKIAQRDALLAGHAAGDLVVVASGALDIYLPILLGELPVDRVLATEMEVEGGRLTGRMLTENCVRAAKRARVERLLAEDGPFLRSTGFGNAPSDLPFLELMEHRVLVPLGPDIPAETPAEKVAEDLRL